MIFPEQMRRRRELDDRDGTVPAPPLAVAGAQADGIIDEGRRGAAGTRAVPRRC